MLFRITTSPPLTTTSLPSHITWNSERIGRTERTTISPSSPPPFTTTTKRKTTPPSVASPTEVLTKGNGLELLSDRELQNLVATGFGLKISGFEQDTTTSGSTTTSTTSTTPPPLTPSSRPLQRSAYLTGEAEGGAAGEKDAPSSSSRKVNDEDTTKGEENTGKDEKDVSLDEVREYSVALYRHLQDQLKARQLATPHRLRRPKRRRVTRQTTLADTGELDIAKMLAHGMTYVPPTDPKVLRDALWKLLQLANDQKKKGYFYLKPNGPPVPPPAPPESRENPDVSRFAPEKLQEIESFGVDASLPSQEDTGEDLLPLLHLVAAAQRSQGSGYLPPPVDTLSGSTGTRAPQQHWCPYPEVHAQAYTAPPTPRPTPPTLPSRPTIPELDFPLPTIPTTFRPIPGAVPFTPSPPATTEVEFPDYFGNYDYDGVDSGLSGAREPDEDQAFIILVDGEDGEAERVNSGRFPSPKPEDNAQQAIILVDPAGAEGGLAGRRFRGSQVILVEPPKDDHEGTGVLPKPRNAIILVEETPEGSPQDAGVSGIPPQSTAIILVNEDEGEQGEAQVQVGTGLRDTRSSSVILVDKDSGRFFSPSEVKARDSTVILVNGDTESLTQGSAEVSQDQVAPRDEGRHTVVLIEPKGEGPSDGEEDSSREAKDEERKAIILVTSDGEGGRKVEAKTAIILVTEEEKEDEKKTIILVKEEDEQKKTIILVNSEEKEEEAGSEGKAAIILVNNEEGNVRKQEEEKRAERKKSGDNAAIILVESEDGTLRVGGRGEALEDAGGSVIILVQEDSDSLALQTTETLTQLNQPAAQPAQPLRESHRSQVVNALLRPTGITLKALAELRGGGISGEALRASLEGARRGRRLTARTRRLRPQRRRWAARSRILGLEDSWETAAGAGEEQEDATSLGEERYLSDPDDDLLELLTGTRERQRGTTADTRDHSGGREEYLIGGREFSRAGGEFPSARRESGRRASPEFSSGKRKRRRRKRLRGSRELAADGRSREEANPRGDYDGFGTSGTPAFLPPLSPLPPHRPIQPSNP
ncbi:uncharacterized protein LOC135110126 [Scylla paramamosain]|uniref:uncharacterized protein LOC135110126 n=1 Tax=Scylla paramamosain TaxID=85552 RepID=UPI0030830A22